MVLLMTSALVVAGCPVDDSDTDTLVDTDTDDDTQVSLSRDVMPVFTARCAPCHLLQGGDAGVVFELESVQDLASRLLVQLLHARAVAVPREAVEPGGDGLRLPRDVDTARGAPRDQREEQDPKHRAPAGSLRGSPATGRRRR
jgi:hypothetical protein